MRCISNGITIAYWLATFLLPAVRWIEISLSPKDGLRLELKSGLAHAQLFWPNLKYPSPYPFTFSAVFNSIWLFIACDISWQFLQSARFILRTNFSSPTSLVIISHCLSFPFSIWHHLLLPLSCEKWFEFKLPILQLLFHLSSFVHPLEFCRVCLPFIVFAWNMNLYL